MDFRHQIAASAGLAGIDVDALVLVVAGAVDPTLSPPLADLVSNAVAEGDLVLKKGRSLFLYRPAGVTARRVVIAVAGDAGAKAFRSALAEGLAALKSSGAQTLGIAMGSADALTEAHAEAAVLATADATYLYTHTKPSATPGWTPKAVTVYGAKSDARAIQQGLRRGTAIAAGVKLAREFANRPGNHCTPSWLGQQAKKIGKEFALDVEVLDRKGIEKLGMGSFLAVSQGSAEPPRFIVARYNGGAKAQPPVVLVGKGITFDTGGVSIKPAAEMDEMKFDMGGAASVLGTLTAVAMLKPRLNLVCIVPACENMPDGRSVKPGDVVTSMSGQTIEILNTDAEGRLILCDALTYAERFQPAVVVDVATLTGACVIALGHHHSGLFTADDDIASRMQAASVAAQDPCWRLPLDEEYDEALKSNFADMGNVGGRPGGAITAAMFLRRFTGKYPWAHLDIAGTAWKSGAKKGATGRPVGLLTHFVLAHAR
ncbi:MAG TPA: leucyl aminopeptidase [Caldimonas sp.]|jgi:leucyl aminopeptidase|nr:leucyl aminopeptidase [Caldimonas sp.]HEX2541485.1 leucyl aminopeptidase [Caldimonas sp.]